MVGQTTQEDKLKQSVTYACIACGEARNVGLQQAHRTGKQPMRIGRVPHVGGTAQRIDRRFGKVHVTRTALIHRVFRSRGRHYDKNNFKRRFDRL